MASAGGTSRPPAMIFPRVNFLEKMIYCAPQGLCLAANSPWMTGELFEQVIDHSILRTGTTPENKSFIFDNHTSHVHHSALKDDKENGVILHTLLPHCSHRMQHLDVGIYGPFITYYNQNAQSFHIQYPGKQIKICDR